MIDKDCEHETEPFYEDDYFMGPIYYGELCKKCGHLEYKKDGPLSLGVYK